jgi:hypothetical protein
MPRLCINMKWSLRLNSFYVLIFHFQFVAFIKLSFNLFGFVLFKACKANVELPANSHISLNTWLLRGLLRYLDRYIVQNLA